MHLTEVCSVGPCAVISQAALACGGWCRSSGERAPSYSSASPSESSEGEERPEERAADKRGSGESLREAMQGSGLPLRASHCPMAA